MAKTPDEVTELLEHFLDFDLPEYMARNPRQRLGQAVENLSQQMFGFDHPSNLITFNQFGCEWCCWNDDGKIPIFMMHLGVYLLDFEDEDV